MAIPRRKRYKCRECDNFYLGDKLDHARVCNIQKLMALAHDTYETLDDDLTAEEIDDRIKNFLGKKFKFDGGRDG